ncbi:spore protease YyaC [Bacillus solimangrovi]|uniref:Spore protease YyaC n=1 Tax=Bacillus solimangrovi TaxID=1305675 RepID=A0A1E5LCC5_9BACI|nr:spore protease YyaC [Bacillus solimangrovi]OEH91745.1 spore protease YyaC [Bacillus solimangrovi]
MNLKPKILDRNSSVFRVLHKQPDAAASLAKQIVRLLPTGNRPIVIVCIGTDRSTGDALGPIAGSKFRQLTPKSSFYLYGNLDEPVHALNLEDTLSNIQSKFDNPFIIGIDASLGRTKNIGVLNLKEGPVKPGAAMNKQLPEVGDIHITGIVNVSGFMEFFVLQNTRLNLVMTMAETIGSSLALAEKLYVRQNRFPKINLRVHHTKNQN